MIKKLGKESCRRTVVKFGAKLMGVPGQIDIQGWDDHSFRVGAGDFKETGILGHGASHGGQWIETMKPVKLAKVSGDV